MQYDCWKAWWLSCWARSLGILLVGWFLDLFFAININSLRLFYHLVMSWNFCSVIVFYIIVAVKKSCLLFTWGEVCNHQLLYHCISFFSGFTDKLLSLSTWLYIMEWLKFGFLIYWLTLFGCVVYTSAINLLVVKIMCNVLSGFFLADCRTGFWVAAECGSFNLY